jgi:RNA polymerase sigma factor (sigma-70 family)
MADVDFESDEFLRRAGGIAWRAARVVLGNNDLADDAAQETLLEFWRHRQGLRPETVFGWIARVAHNKAVDITRRHRGEDPDSDSVAFATIPQHRDDLEEMLSGIAFEQILLVLPDRLGEIARLRYQEDLETRVIAERVGKTAGTVRNNLVEISELVRASLGLELPA